MKKFLTLAGIVAMLGLFSAYAGGIANPESMNARSSVLDAGKAPASCVCPCPQCGSAPCCCKAACPKAATYAKGMTCQKGSKGAASCPAVKGNAKTCPVTGAACKAQKTTPPEKADDKSQK